MRRSFVFGGVLVALGGWAIAPSRGEEPTAGAYPVVRDALPRERCQALESDFMAANGGEYWGQAAGHTPRIASVTQVALLVNGDEGLTHYADDAAVKAALEFVTKNADALGFRPEAVEARPVWVPGWGPTVGLVFRPSTAARFSLGRFLALDAAVRVAGEPRQVASLTVYTFPLPPEVVFPATQMSEEEAKKKLTGQTASVARAKAAGPETVSVVGENLGGCRERIKAVLIPPDRYSFRNVLEIDFHEGAAASTPVVGHWFVDSVTGEVAGQDMVPPPFVP